MNIRTRLILSIVSVGLVIILITLGVTSIFARKRFVWNSHVDIVNGDSNLSYQVSGFVNGAQGFSATTENGAIDNTSWSITREETTFSKEKMTISIQFLFTNKSTSDLKISITGILIDPLNRFSTTATDENDMQIAIVQGETGSLEDILPKGENKTSTIKLNYHLIKTNMNIEGTADDTQNLVVTVSVND